MDIRLFILIVACTLVPSLKASTAISSIQVSQIMRDGETLVSNGGRYELGFFSPGNSQKRYLGLWYKNIPVKKILWVANRANPINDFSGILTLNTTGNLLLTQNGSLVWCTNSHKQAQNPVAELLESGNLMIRDKGETNKEYLWQSFDYPSDTQLAGMKYGWDLRKGFEWKYTCWKSPDDPSPGDFSRVLKLYNYPEFYIMKGTQKWFRFGPWNGLRFTGSPSVYNNTIFYINIVSNMNETYYTYSLANSAVITFSVINETGKLYRYVWAEDDQNWSTFRYFPSEFCDTYGLCGPNGNCVSTQTQACQCLKGFKPKAPQKWNSSDWRGGCIRNEPLSCKGKDEDGFNKFERLKIPDTTYTWLDESIDLEECRVQCLSNCSCMAYTNSDIRNGGSGCVMWFGDLIDIKQYESEGQDLYIRMPASELEPVYRHKRNTAAVVASIVAAICGVLLLSACYIYRFRRNSTEQSLIEQCEDNLDVQMFDLFTIATATDNFFNANKIGEGGFGLVYKGILVDGQEIAVKTLSRTSWQGVTEFINEVKLIAKLQHRNLVKLLGCCIEGQEKMLVYEYMANGSLDYFIFDDRKSNLQWAQRFQIICGVARGLMYLHQDSRLRIIHRDLKASNVLLDENLCPKISDFGLARIFGRDQIEGNTSRIVGTYGYMAPEYAVDGFFSVKSDVFSFGILMLEIICGKKNRRLYSTDKNLNLVDHAQRIWKKGRALELVDSKIKESCIESEVLRCLHICLLCVQQNPEDRPTMTSVILMLESHMELIEPKLHGFITKDVSHEEDLYPNQKHTSTTNYVTMSTLEAR